MRKFKTIILLLCGIAFGLAAFPVFAQKEPSINTKPLQDFAALLKIKLERKEIDLDKPFKLVLEGVLDENGKIDRQKSQFTLAEGDEKMIDLAQSGIDALSDSGYLTYLRALGVEQIKLTVAQDNETFSAQIESEQKDENKANTTASGLNVMIQAIIRLSEKDIKKLSEDEIKIIKGFQVKADGKNFILNFALPKKTFYEILLRNIKVSENNKQSGE